MKLKDQVCSLEFAKRLKDLAVKQKSLFYWDEDGHYIWRDEELQDATGKFHIDDCWSAFTGCELGEMLPPFYYTKRLPDGSWSTEHPTRMDILNTNEKSEADSRAAMIIQLITRGIEKLRN